MKIVVSGANGFVARHVIQAALDAQWDVQALTRGKLRVQIPGVSYVDVGDGAGGVDYRQWRGSADVFVHLAGRAHVTREMEADPRSVFWRANVETTINAFLCAKTSGVGRFIFASSIGVHGNSSDVPVSSFSEFRPNALYAESKLAAELALREQGADAGAIEVAIVRPPLMYGPNVPANFLRLIRLVDTSLPLPFGSVDNRRSFLGVRNFASFILHLARRSAPCNDSYVPADQEITSTPELIRELADLLGKKARILRFPPGILKRASSVVGKRSLYTQLCESLFVDTSVLERQSDWKAPYSQTELLRETIAWYRS